MESFEKYIDSIRSFGRITKDREKELSRIIRRSKNEKNVEKAKEEMVHGNLFLVVNRALKLKKKYDFLPINLMDLIAEGNIALMVAAKNYRSDHKSDASFCSYAFQVIEQRIKRFIRMDKFIHLPEHYLKIRNDLRKLREIYKCKLTKEVVMRELGITEDMLEVLKDDDNTNAVYLEDLFSNEEGDDRCWSDIIEDTKAISPSERLSSNSLMDRIENYLKKLSEREAFVIRERHLKDSPLSYEELSAKLKITKERIRQIHLVALRKLKRIMAIDWEAKYGDHKEPPAIKSCYYYNSGDYAREAEAFAKKKEKQFDRALKHLLHGEV